MMISKKLLPKGSVASKDSTLVIFTDLATNNCTLLLNMSNKEENQNIY